MRNTLAHILAKRGTWYQDVGAKAVKAAGMRAALGGAVLEFPTPYAADADSYIARGLASRDMFAADPNLKLMLTPHAPYTVSDKTFLKLVAIANEMDVEGLLTSEAYSQLVS